eukprot:scaffold78500_cov69-Phaeocystis_antarctica.AAC.3
MPLAISILSNKAKFTKKSSPGGRAAGTGRTRHQRRSAKATLVQQGGICHTVRCSRLISRDWANNGSVVYLRSASISFSAAASGQSLRVSLPVTCIEPVEGAVGPPVRIQLVVLSSVDRVHVAQRRLVHRRARWVKTPACRLCIPRTAERLGFCGDRCVRVRAGAFARRVGLLFTAQLVSGFRIVGVFAR